MPTIVFWVLACLILLVVACLWISVGYHQDADGRCDRAVCITNARNLQIAVRAIQNTQDLKTGAIITFEQLIQNGYIDRLPKCPNGNSYSCDGIIPEEGHLFIRCSDPEHVNFAHDNW